MSEAPSIAEQYLTASGATNLTLKPTPCAADKMLAAGYAIMGDPGRNLALSLWRMKATGDTGGFEPMVDLFDAWAHNRMTRKGQRVGKHTRETVRRTLWWWLNPVCRACDGRGHPVIPDTPVLNELTECPECNGTGKSDVRRLIRDQQLPLALDIIDQMDALSAVVFADMARLLKKDMDDLAL